MSDLRASELPFLEFKKIYRVSRPMVVSEKIDGTNGLIAIGETGEFKIGSRSRWINPGKDTDNYGFAAWATENKEELLKLGVGYHYGEWWGQGIQRKYNINERRWSLFNTSRWSDEAVRPKCCHVVPVLYSGIFSTEAIDKCISDLREKGSVASPGFLQPEGVVVFHVQGSFMLKKTLIKDEEHKSFGKVIQ